MTSKIGWCDDTCNPVTGCTRGCEYCYAWKMAYRLKGRYGYSKDYPFDPTLHFDKLRVPEQRKKATKYFLVSMGDLFDRHIPNVWRYLVFNMARYSKQHTFIVLTKQLSSMVYYLLSHEVPDNLWLGISQDGMTTTQEYIKELRKSSLIPHKFISFEPLLGPINASLEGIDWVIIGAQTNPTRQPRPEWIKPILAEAMEHEIPVFVKDNVEWRGNSPRPQEWPEGLI